MKNQMYFSFIIDAIDEVKNLDDYNKVGGMIRMASLQA